ncbi:MAG: hypothetical protein ACOX8L_02530 [Candidatus Methanomethylophilaceae archaeon]
MSKCRDCGAELTDSLAYCNRCGADQRIPPAPAEKNKESFLVPAAVAIVSIIIATATILYLFLV